MTDTRRLTPNEITEQQRGSTRLGPGLWLDRHGHLHVSVVELIEAFDLEDTPANRVEIERIIRAAWARANATIVRQEPIS